MAPNTNALRKSGSFEEIHIPIAKPMDFNALSLSSVMQIRASFLKTYANRFQLPYRPSDEVFSRVSKNDHWLSNGGMFYIGPTQPTAWKGLSFESTGVLNPFLLVDPVFWGTSIYEPKKINWKEKNLSHERTIDSSFPFNPRPDLILLGETNNQIKVHFDLTSYSRSIDPYVLNPVAAAPTSFGFSDYNANDLGFHTLMFLQDQSKNCSPTAELNKPFLINDYLAFLPNLFNSSPGYNSRVTESVKARLVGIVSLPAQAVFGLWQKNQISEQESKTPDLTYTLLFE